MLQLCSSKEKLYMKSLFEKQITDKSCFYYVMFYYDLLLVSCIYFLLLFLLNQKNPAENS